MYGQYYGGYGCGTAYGSYGCGIGTGSSYALILVLFILLVIIGSAWSFR